jgi:NADH dehydrogenase
VPILRETTNSGLPKGATVTVIGGTGFVGRRLVGRLLDEGARVRVVARRAAPDDLRERGGERLRSIAADLTEPATPRRAAEGAWAVVNLVGTTTAHDADEFYRLHCDAPARLARAAADEGVARLVHFSAMGAAVSAPALADRSKAAGEAAVRREFAHADIVRPALIFGDGDHFLSRFRTLVRHAPVIPLIGGGRTQFQPIFIDDFVEALMRILVSTPARRVYGLGNGEIVTFRSLIEKVCAALGRRPQLIDVPFAAARAFARATQWLPGAPLTVDQVRLLETDKIIGRDESCPSALGMPPETLRTVDDYLHA